MIGILIVTLTGLLLGLMLILIETKFHSDENIEDIYEELLPGYNCGVCGFNTCRGMSIAMAEDVFNYKKCKPLRGEKLKEMEAYLRMNKLVE